MCWKITLFSGGKFLGAEAIGRDGKSFLPGLLISKGLGEAGASE